MQGSVSPRLCSLTVPGACRPDCPAAVDRICGFAREGGDSSLRTSLAASARTALLDALTLPVKALEACASPFLVATASQAAVAVAPVAARVVAHEPRVVKGGCAL
eukprot:4045015-Pleurochrysis_carterae.AAC.8